jgi:hypothetical protein
MGLRYVEALVTRVRLVRESLWPCSRSTLRFMV